MKVDMGYKLKRRRGNYILKEIMDVEGKEKNSGLFSYIILY